MGNSTFDTLDREYTVQLGGVQKQEWSSILSLFDDVTIYQTWPYGAIHWGQNQLHHVLLRHEDDLVAAVQLRVVRAPFFGGGIAYANWGPLWHRRGMDRNPDHLRQMCRALRSEFVAKRRFFLRLKPADIPGLHEDVGEVLAGEGLAQSGADSPYRTLILDLAPATEDIRRRLAQKWRNQLNQAERNGLAVLEGTNDELFRSYIQLHRQLLERKAYVGVADVHKYRAIQDALEAGERMHVMICTQQGTPVAGVIGSVIGERGIYLLGATNAQGLKLKAAYLLQWRMIQVLKSRGCRYYDLGGVNPKTNPGVYHFKAGISNAEYSHCGQFECCTSLRSALLILLADWLKRVRAVRRRSPAC